MNDGFQFLDIIFFAMIAAFLVLRLRSVLGRRTGNERRPREDTTQRRQNGEDDGNVIEMPERASAANDSEAPFDEDAEDDPIAAGLAEIQAADRSFEYNEFVGGSRAAFEMGVHAFATGDTGTLRSLLSDEVYENFQSAIQTRLEAGETLETTVISVKSADVIEAEMRGRMAIVTVKFVTEQVNVTRDTEGHVIDGDPNQVTDVTDIWSFARNTRARDPNWKLIETRSPN